MSNSWSGAWKWTETPEFAQDCDELDPDPGEVDWIRGVIADWILPIPITGSNELYLPTDPRYDPNVRYFKTLDAPGLSELEPKLVIFRIEQVPASDVPRELTGLALWDDPDA